MKRHTRRAFIGTGAAAGVALGVGGLPRAARALEPLGIGVVYASPRSEIGWTKRHMLGADAIRAEFGDRVRVTEIFEIFLPQDAERVFRQLATSGNRLIFATTFSHGAPLQKVVPVFPDVAFEHCSGLEHGDNLGTFEAKYFEGTFVAGAAAGHMTQTGKIGFIGGFPIPDIIGGANGLLRGAQSVNPAVTCSTIFLNSWFDPGKEKAAANTLISQGCDVICSWSETATGVQVAGENGLWSIGYASDMAEFGNGRQLTAYTLDWNRHYLRAARDVLAGNWRSGVYWDGLAAGVVRMTPYNEAIPADVRASLAQLEADVASGKVHPFAGELRDQGGAVRVSAGAVLPDDAIRGMNWFVQGMTGNLG